MHRRFLRFLLLFVLFLAAGGGLIWLSTLKAGVWIFLIDERSQWLSWALAEPVTARLVFVLVYVLYVLVGLPGSLILSMLGGFLFGFVHAVGLACVAATLGAVGLITLVRLFFRPWARRRLGARYDRLAQGFRRNDISYLLFMRLMPVFPVWVVNLVVAVMEMPLTRFAPVSFVAMMPATMAAALVGTGLEQALAEPAAQLAACRLQGATDCAGGLAIPDLLQSDFLLAAGVMGMMALLPPLWQRFRRVQK